MIARVLGSAGGAVTGTVLAGVAAARRAKSVHPRGVVREAALVIDGGPAAPVGSVLLSTPGRHRAIVRFSRSLGLPESLPDLLGMAIRVLGAYGPDRHQDLLLISSADAPILHHLFLPARDARQRPYSSALPYAAGGERFLIGAIPAHDGFALAVAPPAGRFAPVGRIELGAALAPEANAIRFDVTQHTGGGLEPAGLLNRMRRLAYPMSQWAWSRTATDARRLFQPVGGA